MPEMFDPSNDFVLFDGRTTIDFVSTSSESSDTTISDLDAVYRAVSHREAQQLASFGVDGVEQVFHLASSALGATRPKISDKVIDADGTSWRVLRAGRQTLGTRYRLDCRRID